MLARLQDDEGCQPVGIATDQKQAAALARKTRPDVVLAHGGNGNGDLARLRALKKELGLPLVVAGGRWEGDVSRELKKVGVDSLVPGALDAKTLAAALHLAKRNQAGRRDMAKQAAQLNGALQTRKVVGRAVGLLMDNSGMTREQALNHLEDASLKKGVTLEEAAIGVLAKDDDQLN